MTFLVELPQDHPFGLKAIASFETKAEAIAFCREHFGADEEGKICLVSEIGKETKEADNSLSEAELATVLAALRHWQESNAKAISRYQEHFYKTSPLSNQQVDELCERLNCED